MRHWRETHHREDLGDLSGRRIENALLADCRITGLAGARIANCDLRGTEIDIQDLRKLLGVTVTLDCFTFDGLKPSEFVVDAMTYLLSTCDIADSKRQQLRSTIDSSRLQHFDRAFKVLGR